MSDNVILDTRNIKKYFPVHMGLFKSLIGARPQYIRAVDGVSVTIREGEVLGLAGESGCGKTTTAMLVLRMHAPTEGEIYYKGNLISQLKGSKLKEFRKDAQMVFQDPYESLNPRYTVFDTVAEPLLIHKVHDRHEREARIIRALEQAELRPPQIFFEMFPHELSGGQRQRVAIARALVLEPHFLVADEPVSMLDVSIRAGILNLLKRLTVDMGLAGLYISHDLSLIRHICDITAIMYLGKIVEIGPTESIITGPKHPYSCALLAAVPVPDPEYARTRMDVKGEMPSPMDMPPGCRFHPRCAYAQKICSENEPVLTEVSEDYKVACYFPR
jgi:peptide/nickel transport system ATP-binding protein